MKTSESIANLLPGLLEFHRKVPTVLKNEKNDYHNSKYATLDEIISVCKPVLTECGLVVVQSVSGYNSVTTYLYHVGSSEFMCDTIEIDPVEKVDKNGFKKPIDAQAIGSNITYMQRYAYKSMLNIAFGDADDDGNSASGIGAKETKDIVSERMKELNKPKLEIQKFTSEKMDMYADWLIRVIIQEHRYDSVEEALDDNYTYTKKHIHMIQDRFDKKRKEL